MNAGGRVIAALAAAGAVVAAALAWWARPVYDGPPVAQPTAASGPTSVATPPVREAMATPKSHHDAVDEMLQRGSLRGTELDGDWGTWAGATLQPGRSLRRRFDHLLTAIGEVQPEQLRLWIAARVGAQHGEAGADQVLLVWDNYIQLLKAGSTERLDPDNEDAFRRALAAQTTQRNRLLGPAWAHAFYADDDREAVALLARRTARRESGGGDPQSDTMALITPSATPLTAAQAAERDAARVAAFGSEAAQRLRDEDTAWAAWEQRLNDARQAVRSIGAGSFATPVQRHQALEAELARRFEGNELVRARAMLGNEGR